MAPRNTKEPKMSWAQIKEELHERGMTLTELSARLGVSKTICTKVKTQTNYRAQAAIAEFIGEKPEDLWPSRYPKGRPHVLDTNKYPPVHSQKATADTDKVAAA